MVSADPGGAKRRALGKLDQVLIEIKVSVAGHRLRCRWCPAQLRRCRVDGDTAIPSEYPPRLTQHPERVVEEEENDRHGKSCERAFCERQILGTGVSHTRFGCALTCEGNHVFTVVDAADSRSRLESFV